MCGLVGGFGSYELSQLSNKRDELSHMLHSRGPDHEGFIAEDKFWFMHRRLSILDLSDGGNQPMISNNGRYVIAFNGEIYNHTGIRDVLEKEFGFFNWQTDTDTETILEAFGILGVIDGLALLDGMFAIAVYDRELSKMYLARDRFGEKPLTYHLEARSLSFSSTQDTLVTLSGSPSLSKIAICEFLKYGYISSENAIYSGCNKVQPGTVMEFSINSDEQIVFKTKEIKFQIGKNSKNLACLIEEAVVSRMQSDVPVCLFLSGGVDSSLVTYFAQKNSFKQLDSFSIGFEDIRFDESVHAVNVSKFIGTRHQRILFTSSHCANSLYEVQKYLDEPLADPSILPMSVLCKEVGNEYKVALTGDGADELFLSYKRYQIYERALRAISKLRKILPEVLFNKIEQILYLINRGLITSSHQLQKLERIINILNSKNEFQVYDKIVSNSWNADKYLVSLKKWRNLDDTLIQQRTKKRVFDLRNYELAYYLANDILVKSDRSGMAHGLELRSPFLSPDLYAYTNYPSFYDLAREDQFEKTNLRSVLYSCLPKEIVDRPKQGFSLPIASWLRNDLRDVITTEIIEQFNIQLAEVVSPNIVHKIIVNFFNGNNQNAKFIWNLLCLHVWMKEKGHI
jgi:asparagine synthase (glutamine-hydrolysing)